MTTEALKHLLAPAGKLQAQPISDWQGDIPLPEVLADFYANIGPMGDTYYAHIGPVGLTFNVGGNPVSLPPLAKLWALQAGYRWHGVTGERLTNWLSHWLVIAEQGGDPFILDLRSNQVLFAFHGANGWAPQFLAPNVEAAIGGIATVAQVMVALDENAYDADYNIRPEARAAVSQALTDYYNDAAQAQTFLSAWQWHE